MIEIIDFPERDIWEKITLRPLCGNEPVKNRVAEIIESVKVGGDSAIRELTLKYDGANLDTFFVSRAESDLAGNSVDYELKMAIDAAVVNITKFHKAQVTPEVQMETGEGVFCSQRSLPVRRVGLYIPGGSAPLFSTVMMLAIPALIAGCREIALFTPPLPDGSVPAQILYVANLLGISEVIKVGGAQAIAAMAFGTETIKRVDKIFGPGNSYVSQAKLQLSTVVSIDMVAGPSELMIIADNSSKSSFIAADLLSQAEHGPDSQLFLLTASREIAGSVNREIARQLENLPRRSVAEKALENSKVILLENEAEMIEFANMYGPEHLIISTEDPWSVADKIESAGSIFLGNYSPESAGDYASGTNHSLPTSGWTKSVGGVSVDSFMHKITYQRITKQGLSGLGKTIEVLARAEGLEGHKNAVSIRLKEIQNGL